MKTIALIGPSGTGKSHRAQVIAKEWGAEAIIDDGLLIQGSRILAGISAKEQPTRVGAIRAALFNHPAHAQEVKEKIKELAPRRLLILGTSREMVQKIAARLELPEPSEYIEIEKVASPREIAQAKRIRAQLGKHVIPVPTVEVKPRFNLPFVEPLRALFHRQPSGRRKVHWVDQTAVRPTFSYLGRFCIDPRVVASIASYLARSHRIETHRCQAENRDGSLILDLEVSVPHGEPWLPLLRSLQRKLKNTLAYMTALEIQAINVHVVGICLPPRKAEKK
ncbi:MAG TPA: Asp23/Gls24 family envelope stress response protein [Moorella mulderi]|nr:Asp23/Gls24 family envelope stress response protein [Moorella mulderi]